ncbi:DUF6891 domain-containing protein [Myxococcus sp. Y35]|uniref:DUF6891 domain-containing protein n=1 Tax=Pseudomyxococcus flavus TaxID=3115648 RepID=UPI003CF1EBB5
MDEASQYEQARAVVDEVMPDVEDLGVHVRADGIWFLILNWVNQDSGEVLERAIASSDGSVLRPELVAKLEWTERVEEVARRWSAVALVPPQDESATTKQIEAIAREVLKGSGFDPIVWEDDEGHLQVDVELVHEEKFKFEYMVLATTRGDVPMPKRTEAFGLRARAEELARRLGELSYAPPPLSEAQASLIQEPLAELRRTFEYGTYALPDISDGSGGGDWDDLDDDRVRREVWKAFEKEVRARLEEERHWPEVIEADRLDAAFDDLNRAGIVAEMGATNTLSGGWSYVREIAAERARRGVKSWAAAFFHEQDLDIALKGHGVCIAFGTLDGEELTDQDLKVAEAVVEALRKHGLAPEWNGSVHTRITVPAFTWRRRRSSVDTSESATVGLYCFSPSMVDLLPRVRSVTVRADRLFLYDLDRMHSRTLEELTCEFRDDLEASSVLPDLLERVKGRFPKLKALAVKGDRSFSETVRFDG